MTTPAEPGAFVPAGFTAPDGLDHHDFRLRPLGPPHNERDHAAWMGSIAHIRATPGYPDGSWPSEMSLDENLADLERHARDFRDGRGFTYTVLAPEGHEANAAIIGCVYLYPDHNGDGDVVIQTWVVAERAELDTPLADAVRTWLHGDEWPWPSESVRDHRG